MNEPNAIAYLERPRGAEAEAIRAACEGRGWPISESVTARPGGLPEALGRAAGGGAVLVVARLDLVAGSLSELAGTLEWLASAGAGLLSLDPPLDTTSAAGRALTTLLGSLTEWERDLRAERARRSREDARARGRPVGPPAVADDPRLLDRIRRLRESGLSLRAIAETLESDGVPTPRGGARWRASSVQAALGYRRPPPPPPPPPGGPHRPPRPPRGGGPGA